MERLKGWSPSDFERYSQCTASPALITELWDYIRDDKAKLVSGGKNDAAQEGNEFHELFEFCQTMGCSARSFVKNEKFKFHDQKPKCVAIDMATAVDDSLEYLRNVLKPGDQVELEKQVAAGGFHPGKKPIIDILVFNEETCELHVMDLKYSSHRDYQVSKNGQLKINAVCAYWDLTPEQQKKCKGVSLHLVQPRKPYMEEWFFSKKELFIFEAFAHDVYLKINSKKDREYKWGKHCVFCPAAVRCREAKKNIVSIVFGSQDLPEDVQSGFRHPDAMSNQELFELWPYFDLIASWANKTVKFMDQAALQGQRFGDLKLVEGRKSPKSWINERDAEEYLVKKLGEEAYEKKLKSPTQAGHLLGKENAEKEEFLELYNQEDGKPKLADADDPRRLYYSVLVDELQDED